MLVQTEKSQNIQQVTMKIVTDDKDERSGAHTRSTKKQRSALAVRVVS